MQGFCETEAVGEDGCSYISQAMTRRHMSSVMSSVKWRGEVHEWGEGGSHVVGHRPQDGRDVPKEEMEKWMSATDDVTGADLSAGLVSKARREYIVCSNI